MANFRTMREVADCLGVDPATISRHASRNSIGVRLGWQKFFTKKDCEKLRKILAKSHPGGRKRKIIC